MLHEDFSSFTLLSNYSAAVLLSSFSRVQLCATLWTVVYQAPLSMGFSRQEYWSGLPCPPPGDLPDPGIKPVSLMSPTLAGGFFITSATWQAMVHQFQFQFSRSVVSDSLQPLWTVGHQTPLSMGFSRQEYWSGLPCPPPGDLPNPGIEPMSPGL